MRKRWRAAHDARMGRTMAAARRAAAFTRGLPARASIDAGGRRFLARERRDMERAARPTMAVLALASAVALVTDAWAHPSATLLVFVSLGQILIAGSGAILAGRIRRHALGPLVFATTLLAFQGPVVTIALAEELAASTLAYMTLIPLGAALFLPWPTRLHLLWLVGVGIVSLELALILAERPGWPIHGPEAMGVMFITGLLSLAGSVAVRRRRRAAFLRQMEVRRLAGLLDAENRRLSALSVMLAGSARLDTLTGIANRRGLEEDLTVSGSPPGGAGDSVLMIDLDRFKALNDTLGHAAGDDALRLIAVAIARQLRDVDQVYRYGGEEFLVLLHDVTAPVGVANRIRRAIRALRLPNPGNEPSGLVTVSIGIAPLVAADRDGSIARADEALYVAKRSGRDRVDVWAPAAA